MDEYFPIQGPSHRKMRHHKEGIEEARNAFGSVGAQAAAIHILRDCRHIPSQQDYDLGYVDLLGLKKHWSVSAYIHYTEEDFESLVNQLLQPSGVMLWSFIDAQSLPPFLVQMTRFAEHQIQELVPSWNIAKAKREQLPPLTSSEASSIKNLEGSSLSKQNEEAVRGVFDRPIIGALKQSLTSLTFAYVPVDLLVNPLVFIDYEYIESLKPELIGKSDTDVINFAIPERVSTQVNVIGDATMKNILFVSRDKTITVAPGQVSQSTDGTEVKFVLSNSFSAILVANISGRLMLRNGIHRTFLLAKLGLREIPCLVFEEENPAPTQITGYPTFTPATLMQLRPPLLADFLNPDLCLEVPLRRMQKIIKISTEEMIVPVD
jgi:hypothetical protein